MRPRKPMKYLPFIFRNLMRNRRRTLLSVLSIGISMFIFSALMSLPAVVRQLLHDRISNLRLDCANKAGFGGYDYTLPLSYAATIRAMPHVDAVSGALYAIGNYRDPGQMVPILAVEPSQMSIIYPDWGITPELASALEHSRSSGLVTAAMMKRYRWRIGDNVTFHSVNLPTDVDVTIAGSLDGANAPPNMVMVPFERLNQAMGNRGNAVLFFIRIDRSESANPVIREIDSRFANSAFETSTQTELGMAQNRLQNFRLLFVGVQFIAVVIAMVIGLVASNTAAMSVRERRHELAVMRSLGFTRRMLVGSIVIEGLMIGLAAGALGAVLAYLALAILGSDLLFAGRMVLHLTPAVAAGSIALASVIGLSSAAIPALNATRYDIATALRATV
jgi:putative ABC transport system permease protein